MYEQSEQIKIKKVLVYIKSLTIHVPSHKDKTLIIRVLYLSPFTVEIKNLPGSFSFFFRKKDVSKKCP